MWLAYNGVIDQFLPVLNSIPPSRPRPFTPSRCEFLRLNGKSLGSAYMTCIGFPASQLICSKHSPYDEHPEPCLYACVALSLISMVTDNNHSELLSILL